MKKNIKLILLSILVFITTISIIVILYFYIAFSGNPIDRFSEQRQIKNLYESRYDEDFIVTSSNYDYKRKEFSFQLASQTHPEIEFNTTLDESNRIDTYAAARSIYYLDRVIDEALGLDFIYLAYHVNVYEDYRSPGILETDLHTRLSQNQYTIYFSWETPLLDTIEVEAVFKQIAHRISQHLDIPVGGLKISVGVYDGKNYHHTETELGQ